MNMYLNIKAERVLEYLLVCQHTPKYLHGHQTVFWIIIHQTETQFHYYTHFNFSKSMEINNTKYKSGCFHFFIKC